jgi:hypothetical protein
LAGWLSAIPLGATAISGLVLLSAMRTTRQDLISAWRDWKPIAVRVAAVWRDLPGWMRWLTLGFLIFTTVRFAVLVWALPPFVWDSLTYHLTNVAQWIQDGRIHLFDSPIDRIYSPANYEVLAAWMAVFLHHDVVIEAAGIPAYVLGGLSVYALGRAFRLPTFAAWLSALAFLSTPAIVYAATGTKNDPFVAATYLFLAALILDARNRLEESGDHAIVGVVVLLALGSSYAFGTKAYMAHLAVGLLVLILAPWTTTSIGQVWSRARSRFELDLAGTSRAGRFVLLGLLGCGVVLGAYWNVRNWALKGNPFYPYDIAYETQSTPATGSGHYGLGWARLADNLRVLADKFGDKRARILPDLPETTGWGWLVYGMGLLASVWAVVRHRRFRFLALGFGVSMVLLMASNTTSPWNMRYFIWLPALFCLGLGLFFEPLASMDPTGRRLLVGLFGFGLVMNMILTANYGLVSIEEISRMLSFPVGDRAASRFHLRAPIEYELAYDIVPAEALLGYNVHANGFVYPLYRADFSQALVYIPFSESDTCESIASAMEARGTRYLFVAPEHTDDGLIRRLRECAAADASPIRERARGLYVVKRDGE